MISVYRDDDLPDESSGPKSRGRTVYETAGAQCHGMDKSVDATKSRMAWDETPWASGVLRGRGMLPARAQGIGAKEPRGSTPQPAICLSCCDVFAEVIEVSNGIAAPQGRAVALENHAFRA
jgi:hypothetical protein